MALLGLRLCARAPSSCGEWGPLLITVRGPLTIAASPAAEHRLQTRRLSNCGSRAQPLCSMRDPPIPGLEPVSPALAGRLSTTAPPGKPSVYLLIKYFLIIYHCFQTIWKRIHVYMYNWSVFVHLKLTQYCKSTLLQLKTTTTTTCWIIEELVVSESFDFTRLLAFITMEISILIFLPALLMYERFTVMKHPIKKSTNWTSS